MSAPTIANYNINPPDGEGAVVPDDQEHEHQVQHAVVEEVVGSGQDAS